MYLFSRCFPSKDNSFWKFFPNYLVSYIPLLAVMIINPILYCSSSKLAEIMVSQYLSQYTNKERLIVDLIKIKFGLINLTFYACWLPNVINAFIIFLNWNHFPRSTIVSLWYIMVIYRSRIWFLGKVEEPEEILVLTTFYCPFFESRLQRTGLSLELQGALQK